MAREVAAKIVFYGPGLSGKTTTLKKIHDSVKPAHRGEMMSLPTEADRTLFFDFLPVKVERVGDCAVRLALYTVPGQVFYNATRRLVLQGADGVVFVADSQPLAVDSNCESLKNLEENLFEQGIRLERFPLVLQYNKRDLPNALPVDELRAMLNPRGVPDFETCATGGQGVLDALKTITRLVIKDLRAKRVVPPSSQERATRPQIPALGGPQAEMQDQVSHQLEAVEDGPPTLSSVPPMATPFAGSPRVRLDAEPSPVTSRLSLGPASALAPAALLDYARAADLAFVSADYAACVRACHEATRRGLGFAGEGSLADQGYLLGVTGADLLKLLGLVNQPAPQLDDAAFALYVLMQVFTRLKAAQLPSSS
jgi:signal recognition particle receptor subunit beta